MQRNACHHEWQGWHERPQSHAQRIGSQSDQQEMLPCEPLGEERHHGKHQDLRHLADGHQATTNAEHLADGLLKGALLHNGCLNAANECVRLHKVELVNDADRDCNEKQQHERHLGNLAKCLKPRRVLLGIPRRRRVWKDEAIQAHQDAKARTDLECHRASCILSSGHCVSTHANRRVVTEQNLTNCDAHRDPTNRSPDADRPKVRVAIRNVCERQRVGQRHRRRVHQSVQGREREEVVELASHSHKEN